MNALEVGLHAPSSAHRAKEVEISVQSNKKKGNKEQEVDVCGATRKDGDG